MTMTPHAGHPALSAFTPLALALWALSSGAGAQTLQAPPTAGQVLRELQPAPVLPMPQAAPLPRPDAPLAPAAPGEATVRVESVVITGNQSLPTAQLQPLVAGLIGRTQNMQQLEAAARRITADYRQRGFLVARAYLPAQDITSGVVTIAVVEGRVATARLSNRSRLSDDSAQAYLAGIEEGDVIRSGAVDRGLLLLQDTPGVSASRATLVPGASVGTSDLLVELEGTPAHSAVASLDNHGSRYTGLYRVGGSFSLASPLHVGDQLSFTGLSSGDGLRFGRLAYQMPVGSDGLRVGTAYLDTRYRLGKEFASLEAHGFARSASVFAAYPFVRSQLANLGGTLALERKQLNDRVDSTSTETGKTLTLTSLGLAGNLQDAWGGGGINSFELNWVLGTLRTESPSALAIDAASSRSNGRFSRIAYSAGRLQRLTRSTALSVSLAGQQASKNLDASEKFLLGGANGVRAYPQGEGIGDQGHRVSIELQHTLATGVQGTFFYDAGHLTVNKNPFGPPAANSRTLAGVGVGLNASVGALALRASLAWRTKGGGPLSVPASASRGPTLWVMTSVAF